MEPFNNQCSGCPYVYILLGMLLCTALNPGLIQGQPIRVVEDFQVNQISGEVAQEDCRSVILSDGGFLLAWVDARNGNKDVWAQKYSVNAVPVGDNFKINQDIGNTAQDDISIGIDRDNNIMLVWKDNRGGVFGQLMSPNGSLVSDNFKINPDSSSNTGAIHVTESDVISGFIVTWASISSVHAQRLDALGNLLGEGIANGPTAEEAKVPNINIDAEGRYLLTWIGRQWNERILYHQRGIGGQWFDAMDVPIGDGFFIVGDYRPDPAPLISLQNDRSFVLLSSVTQLFLERFNPDGTQIGDHLVVFDDKSVYSRATYDIVPMLDDSFVVIFSHYSGSDNPNINLYSQRFASDAEPIGQNELLLVPTPDKRQDHPHVSPVSNGQYVITWLEGDDFLYLEDDIWCQRFAIDGSPQEAPWPGRVQEEGSASQRSPLPSLDNKGNLLVLWLTDASSVGQLITSDGTLIGENFAFSGKRVQRKIAAHLGDDFVYAAQPTFEDELSGISLYKYRTDGSKIFEKEVGETNSRSIVLQSLEVAPDSSMLVIWRTDEYLTGKLKCQRFDVNGNEISQAFYIGVGYDEDDYGEMASTISLDDGAFWVIWNLLTDLAPNSELGGIYAQKYSWAGKRVGEPVVILEVLENDYKGSVENLESVRLPNGNIMVAWSDTLGGRRKLHGQVFTSEMEALDKAHILHDKIPFENPGDFSLCVMNDDTVVVAWVESTPEGGDIRMQFITPYGEEISESFLITNTTEGSQTSPVVKTRDNLIYTVWVDDRIKNTGTNIWANIHRIDLGVSVDRGQENKSLLGYQISQNYPNPFNPVTTIEYQLPEDGEASIKVFDLRGQEVATLLHARQVAGRHRVTWDASQFANGIYLYRIQSKGRTIAKKMILVK